MNKSETLQIMAVLRCEYPDFCRGLSAEDIQRKADLWTEFFAEDDAGLVGAAVKSIILTDEREFAPKVGTIKEKMRQLTNPDELTEAGAWALIAKAAQNGIYGAAEEFAKLPPTLQKLVGNPGQLREWAMMDSGSLHSVVASNIQRAYRTVAKREREQAKLPADIKAMISAIADKMTVEGQAELPRASKTNEDSGGRSWT